MSSKNFCTSSLNQWLLVLLAGIILYNERLALDLAAHSWAQLPMTPPPNPSAPAVSAHQSGVPVRLLLVSDPQILSTLSEPRYPLSMLTVWDANRFIRNGFYAAVHAAKADVVIFLGDLFNDGSIANDNQFTSMVADFQAIFSMPDHVKLALYLPGDNDVGGEGEDIPTKNKRDRFAKAFPSPKELKYLFLDFVHVSPEKSLKSPASPNPISPGIIRLLLSHVPLMPGTSYKKTILSEQPSLIFSGHHHDSFRFIGLKSEAQATQFWPLDRGSVLNVSLLTEQLNELVVPTCSYRMGKQAYGYGLAIIDSRGWLQYSVLWLPTRFSQLLLYVLWLVLLAVTFTMPRLCRAGYASVMMLKLYWRRYTGHSKRGYVRLKNRS